MKDEGALISQASIMQNMQKTTRKSQIAIFFHELLCTSGMFYGDRPYFIKQPQIETLSAAMCIY